MKPEVVFACLTLCLVEAGSSHRRRSLATAPFTETDSFSLESRSPLVADQKEANSYWSETFASPDIYQPASFLLSSLTSSTQLPARDLKDIVLQRLPRRNRFQLLQEILRQATHQFREDTALTPEVTKRQMTSSLRTMGKRRSRCDFTRVSIQMILEYFRTRRVCGYRVNRVRFGLGGK